MTNYIISDKGLDFNEEPLTSDSLDGVKEVLFNKCIYNLGACDCECGVIELFRNNEYYCNVCITELRLIQ